MTTVPDGEAERPCHRADLSLLDHLIHPRHLRRVDRFSNMALLGARLALDEAGLDDHDPARIGLVIASGYGSNTTTFEFFHECLRDGDQAASPTKFSKSGHSSVQSSLSILLGLRGPTLTVCQPDLAAIPALMTARSWLLEDRVDAVLVGGLDEVFDLRVYNREHLHRQANDGPMRPLDLGRQSSVLGEGAFFLALTRPEPTPATGTLITAVNWGQALDGRLDLTSSSAALACASGHRAEGEIYEKLLSDRPPTLAFAPLVGTTPVNLMFHLVVADELLRERHLTPLPMAACSRDLPTEPQPPDTLSCLDARGSGAFGHVALAGQRRDFVDARLQEGRDSLRSP